jgi:hypothetical protein
MCPQSDCSRPAGLAVQPCVWHAAVSAVCTEYHQANDCVSQHQVLVDSTTQEAAIGVASIVAEAANDGGNKSHCAIFTLTLSRYLSVTPSRIQQQRSIINHQSSIINQSIIINDDDDEGLFDSESQHRQIEPRYCFA